MKDEILKLLNAPLSAARIFQRNYLNLSNRDKIFAHKKEYRSDSENGEYAIPAQLEDAGFSN